MMSLNPSFPLALIADDDADVQQMMRLALEGDGWQVIEAHNGREALSAFQQFHPTVVLLDVIMPEMDGFATCKALRQLPNGAYIPILIITARNDTDSIALAYEAGATDFIAKPLNGLLLTHRVRYIARSNQILQELQTSQTSLVQARDAALEGTRLKSAFLGTVSHELRTPLNGILGMADLLLDTSLTPEQHIYADAIRTSGNMLLSIVNNILDFSKIESGNMPLQHVAFDLTQLLDNVVDQFAERARLKGVSLTSSIHTQVPTSLYGDPFRLHQTLSNLVSNAVKFTECGEISIRVETDTWTNSQGLRGETHLPMPDNSPVNSTIKVRFSVADTGIGIAPDAYTRIFQPFGQADGSNTRKYGGAGLGLAICQQLADLMGGVIGMESELHRGSVFHFTVPLERRSDVAPNRPQHNVTTT